MNIEDTGRDIVGYLKDEDHPNHPFEVIRVSYDGRLRTSGSSCLPTDIHKAHQQALIMVEAIELAMRRFEDEEK